MYREEVIHHADECFQTGDAKRLFVDGQHHSQIPYETRHGFSRKPELLGPIGTGSSVRRAVLRVPLEGSELAERVFRLRKRGADQFDRVWRELCDKPAKPRRLRSTIVTSVSASSIAMLETIVPCSFTRSPS